jgi:hypothetical protein
MVSDTVDKLIPLFVFTNIMLLIWFFTGSYFGYQNYIQFPKTQQPTQCRVHESNAMNWFSGKFQAIWTVDFNDTESEKISKIFVSNYTTFTDAIEATMNQYKVRRSFY